MKLIRSAGSAALTFVLISLSWVFFRADTFSDAFTMLGHLFLADSGSFSSIPEIRLWAAGICLFILIAVEFVMTHTSLLGYLSKISSGEIKTTLPKTAARLICYGAIAAVIIILGAYDNRSFIYFQF